MRKASFIIQVDQMLEPIYSDYLKRLDDISKECLAAFENKDYALIQNYAHQVAGNGASYGLEELGSIAKEIEKACKDGLENDAKIKDLLKDFSSYLSFLSIEFVKD